MSFSGNSADSGRGPCAASSSLPAERVDAACRMAAEGKLAARRIAAWLHGSGINEPEFRLLWLLAGGSQASSAATPCDQAEMAARLVVSPAQVSGAVERLRGAGLLQREHDERDRRRQLWQITAEGKALLLRVVNLVATLPRAREAAA